MELGDAVAMLKTSFLAIIDHFTKLHHDSNYTVLQASSSSSDSHNAAGNQLQSGIEGVSQSKPHEQETEFTSVQPGFIRQTETSPVIADPEIKSVDSKKIKRYSTAFQAFSMQMRDKVRSEMNNPSSSKLSRYLKKRFASLSEEEKLPFEKMVVPLKAVNTGVPLLKKRRIDEDLNTGDSTPLDDVAKFLEAETLATKALMPEATEEAVRMSMLRHWAELPDDQRAKYLNATVGSTDIHPPATRSGKPNTL
ncbi:hypothetical protein HDE_00898 [Halotydeus destructor]|nr:hypothetical protein HDE_00898 [Halotydeus destructor]